MSFRILLLLVMLPVMVTAQSSDFQENFSPSPFTDTIPPLIQGILKVKKESIAAAHSELNRSELSSLRRFNDNRSKQLVDLFNGDYFITKGDLFLFLQETMRTVTDANASWKHDAFVVGYRDASPNAFSTIDGLIAVNLGLLARLENKGELAYVLSHELAHYYLDHAENYLVSLAKLDNSKELKQNIRSVKSSQYQQYSRMKSLVEDIHLSTTRHIRGHEFEADSLGFLLFLKAGYAADDAVRLLKILDSVDLPRYRQAIDLKKNFDFEEYPFKMEWGIYTPSPMWHVKKTNAKYGDSDTTKTHPDINRRVAALYRLMNSLPAPLKSATKDYEMRQFATQGDLDIVESTCHFKQFGKSFFLSLAMQETYPKTSFLHAMIGRNLYEIYNAEKNHQLGHSVALPSEKNEDNYNRVLAFLHRLRLTETALVAYNYATHCDERDFNNEEFLYTFWLISQLPGSKMDTQTVRETYLQKFPQGSYRRQIRK